MSSTQPTLRIVALGGLGEIGMNCLVVESDNGSLVIDCGVTFPHQDYGIDEFHPDLSYVVENASLVRGIVITHGHEDHIGAVPYLLRRVSVPVWGPAYALSLLRERLRHVTTQAGPSSLIQLRPRKEVQIGPFSVEPVQVAHSIADAYALFLRTPAGTVLHTGDFKFDAFATGGDATDVQRLKELGNAGVGLLLSDSTNVDRAGESGSERSVAECLARIVAQVKHRVIVGLFSSNVHRLRALYEIARANGRRICLLGKSVQVHWSSAVEHGLIPSDSAASIPASSLYSAPREGVLIVASGTQAEPASALSKLASNCHQHFNLQPDDTVFLSSRIIPGNDRRVLQMIGDLIRQGVQVRSLLTDPDVHVSGHGDCDGIRGRRRPWAVGLRACCFSLRCLRQRQQRCRS